MDISDHDRRRGMIGTGVAVLVWGMSGVLIKSIDLDPLAVGFWRFMPYSVLVAMFLLARGTRVSLHTLRATAIGGLCLGLDVILFFTAIKLTNVVNATTISSLQPLVVSVAAVRMFGERINAADAVAALIAIAGVVTIVLESSGSPEWSGPGDIAAVGALFAWSGYFIYSKKAMGKIDSGEYSFGTGCWTAAACLVAGLAFGQDMAFPPTTEWPKFIVLICGAGVLGHLLMNWSLVRVPLWFGSTLTLLIPVIGAFAARYWLDEPLTSIQVVAMVVVVAALAAVVVRQTRTPVEVAAVAAEPAV